jgi:DNA-directed RNA polymerase subunit alpha
MIYEIEEYLSLSNKEKYTYLKKRVFSIQDELKKLEDVIIQDNLFIKIHELELSVRTMNGLIFHNINYVGDLVKFSEGFLLRAPNFGRKSLNEVKEVLKNLGLELGMDVVWPPCIIQHKDKRFFNKEMEQR